MFSPKDAHSSQKNFFSLWSKVNWRRYNLYQDYTISFRYVLSEGCAQFTKEFFLPVVESELAQV